MEGVTFTTLDDRIGDIGIFRKYMDFPVFGEERYAIQKINTDIHGCVQLGWKIYVCSWWEWGFRVGWYAALKKLEGDYASNKNGV